MNKCCIHLRIRSKKYKKYFYFEEAKKEICIEVCKNCPFKRRTKSKQITKVSNGSVVKSGCLSCRTSSGKYVSIEFSQFPFKGSHKHHIFNGCGLRNLSEKYGLYIYVSALDHVMSSESLHENPELLLTLKKIGQLAFNKAYPNLDFVEIFGKNYL